MNFALTIFATLYFGWHYIADDLAGIMIALISFYVGGLASGQKFDRHGLASHPTTTTSGRPRRAGLTSRHSRVTAGGPRPETSVAPAVPARPRPELANYNHVVRQVRHAGDLKKSWAKCAAL